MVMKFHKYPSLDNVKETDLAHYHYYNPGKFVVQEKVDGCNIGLYITKNDFRIASRNQFVDDSFYNIQGSMHLIEEFIQDVKNSELINIADYLIFYGEFYGPGIQKRINYGKRGFAFFDACKVKSDEIIWLSFKEFMHFFKINNAEHLVCPVIDEFENIFDAYNFCKERIETTKSFISQENNIPETEYTQIEGYVIANEENFFKLKYKSDAFLEKAKSPTKKTFGDVADELKEFKAQFLTYINENRFHSVMSKCGCPTSISQASEYIHHLINDAKEEFEKDFKNELDKFSNKEKRFIYNAGSLPFEIFKKFV